MKLKITIIVVLVFLLSTVFLTASQKSPETLNFISNLFSHRAFKTGAISDDVITDILFAGHKAPSARNNQPWHFTVVKNKNIISKILPNLEDGNVLVIISGKIDTNKNILFDAGLATQNMFIAAQTFGLAARIYQNPVQNINDNLLKTLEIPAGNSAIMVLRLGFPENNVDAITTASPRLPINEKINIIKQ
jgi:nitroreductase